MKNRIARVVVLASLMLLLLSGPARATTWAPYEVACPICKTKNTFMQVMSFGNYIYQWPSKFQYIYWPLTDGNVLYSCKKCHLTTFMWDFEKLPPEKLPLLEKMLAGVPFSGSYAKYTDIPMTQRLAVAEKVYQLLGEDEDWWGRFYRVEGYHFAAERKQPEADAARRKALEIARKQLAEPANAERRKELLLVTGGMKFFLNDEAGALQDLNAAAGLKYVDAKIGAEKSAGFDGYLSDVIEQFIEGIHDEEKKRTEPVWPHKILEGHNGWVMTLAVAGDNSRVASADINGGLLLWNARTGAQERRLPKRNVIQAVAFSADGQLLASGGYNKVVDLWNPQTGELLRSLKGHQEYVSALAFSPDGRLLASGSWDNTIKLWDTKTWKELRTLSHQDSIWDLAFTPDGGTIVSTDMKGNVKIWDAATGALRQSLPPNEEAQFVAVSPDGKTIATEGDEDTIALFDARTGGLLRKLKGESQHIVGAAFAPDGKALATIAWDGKLELLDAATGKSLTVLTTRGDKFRAVAFTPDGQTIVTASNDGTVRLWDVRPGAKPLPPAPAKARPEPGFVSDN